MKINDTFYIDYEASDMSYISNLIDPAVESRILPSDPRYYAHKRAYDTMTKSSMDVNKDIMLRTVYERNFRFTEEQIKERLIGGNTPEPTISNEEAKVMLEAGLQELMDFLSHIHFEPSIRFVNTLLLTPDKDTYIKDYFKLQDNPGYTKIVEEMKSQDWMLVKEKLQYVPKNRVNNHLIIYYGPAGTGKTTLACAQSKTCIICSSDTTPKDLLQDFNFEDGKATFNKSVLWQSIEAGETIAFDEINFLPKDTRQFLQGLTDNKESIDFLGNNIKIHPDFKIIGTMNLVIEGVTIPLSEPLVDRCAEIKEFKLTAHDLYKAMTE